MGRFTVYSKDGQTVRCVLDKLEYTGVFMAERACTSTFISDVKINFDVFDYIDYRGERFELELLPTVKKISKHQYSYDLNFVSLKHELERCMMRNIVPSDNGIVYPTPLVVEFTGTVKYLAERIQACLDAMYGKGVWSITLADGVDSEEKNISMSNQNCWSALSLVNTEYKLNYFVKGRSVTIGGAEPVVNNVFEYGKGKGLYEIERISDADTGIVTKLRAYGGTRNLDYSYPKKPEWTDSILPANYALSPLRLMLPSFKTDGVTDFVLASNEAIAKYGICEGVITYDDIYPSITGMKNSAGQAIDEIKSVDAITSETQPTFTVQLYDLGFDLNESLTTDEAQLSMKSGALQGYAFTITKIVKASDGSYTLTLGRNTLEESDTDNFTVPNKDWNMKAGDRFVLLNILMPQEYIRAAENRLLERAKEYLAKYSSTNYSYNIGVDEIFMARNANFYNEIMEGKRLTVNDPEMGIDHENVIIQSLSIKEGEGLIPTFEVTLNNEPSASTLERIQGQISEIETSVNNKFSSQSELSKQYRKKLDKVVWDRNLEERVDDNGKEYLFLTKPLITAYGVTMYAGADVQVPSIYEGLPIDGVTIQWVDGKLVSTGGKGTANGIVVNGNTYTPNEDGIITLPNYPSLSGYATEQWVNNTLSGYATSSSLSQLSAKVDNFLEGTDTDGIINKWKELESFLAGQTQTSTLAELLSVKADKATTLAGYGITDAYTKNDISGLLADYVTKSGAQDITGIKSFINGLNIGDILVKKHSDGVVELDGDLILTGSLTMYAGADVQVPSIYEGLPIDGVTIQWVDGKLVSTGGKGTANGIVVNGNTYTPNEDGIITLPNYPTTLPASDVYSWAKQPNKPSYSFDELSSHPTTLGGYGITDAVTIDTHQQIYGSKEFRQTVFIDTQSDVKLIMRDDDNHALIGAANSKGSVLSRLGYYGDRWGIDGYKILTTNNYSAELDNRYVNKAGDTMTGTLLMSNDSDIYGRSSANSGAAYIIGYRDASISGIVMHDISAANNTKALYIQTNGYDAPSDTGGLAITNDCVTAFGSGDNGSVFRVLNEDNVNLGALFNVAKDGTLTRLGNRIWDEGNDGSGSGLDADLLDGKHLGNVGDRVMRQIGFPYYREFGSNDTNVYLRKVLGWCYNNVNTGASDTLFVGVGHPNALGNMQIQLYCADGINSDGYPRYSSGVFFPLDGLPSIFGTNDYNYYQHTLATTDGNVYSATKLQTPRTIFSKPFDGTNNVTGGAKFLNICIETDNNGNDSGRGSEINNYVGPLQLQQASPNGIHMCMGGGQVGIGTTSPSYKLSVNGDTYCSGKITSENWIRSDLYSAGIDHYADDSYSAAYNACAPNNDNYCCYSIVRAGTIPLGIGFNTNNEIWLGTANTNRKAADQWLQISSGQVTCSSNLLAKGGITMYSDLRKKNVLNSIIVPLDVMANADLFDYIFKTDEKGKVRAGTSAQYWNAFLPQVTDTDNEGFFTMSYDVLATTCVLSMAKHFQRFLIEDFNNHETRIEFLERENKELKDSNKEMMNRIIELERRAA